MAVVSQTPNIKNIQGQIADLLNFKLDKESEEGRAEQLYLRLEKEKKILIILDDVWAKLDLKTIGVPCGDVHQGCKIFLTTRRQQVCLEMMCHHQIPLDALNEKEGSSLFKKHAGISDDSPTLNDLAVEVAGECKGLPLAIVSIGSALRGKAVGEWKEALRKLKMSKLNVIENVNTDVYACLQLSYDYLKSEEIKFYFLLCSLFPEDHKIDLEELVRYGMGLGLNPDAESIEDSRDQLPVMVHNLKSSCLLLDAGEEAFIKMHDVVRDFAIWTASKQQQAFLVKPGISEWPKEERHEQYMAINLLATTMTMLPDGLIYPNLKILLLDAYDRTNVSDAFFEEMKALKVLSLTYGQLSIRSLQFLTNLRTLHLKCCKLEGISSLGKLKRLEMLSLKGSEFDELPVELGELSQLRLLDLFDCSRLKRIPFNVLRRLSHLEELYIGSRSFSSWEVEGTNAGTRNVSLSELNSLPRLTHLLLHIQDKCLPKGFAFSSSLRFYEIEVNEERYPCGGRKKFSKSRNLNIFNAKLTTFAAFKALYPTLEHFKLRDIRNCENIVPTIDPKGLNELKSLKLCDCRQLKCIVDESLQQVKATAFSNLVELSLEDLRRLREICQDERPPKEFLEKLESIDVNRCHDMYSLFPTMLLQRLDKLKKVQINNCNKLQEVFKLEGLCHSGEENPELLSSLAELELGKIGWVGKLPELRFIWKGPTQYLRLKNLIKVQVCDCHSLTYLFLLSFAPSLVQLEEVIVWRCGRLEHIVLEDNKGEENGYDILFPKLRRLELSYLPNLISLCPKSYELNWQTLEELVLNDFHNVAPSFTVGLEDNMKTPFENLRLLHLFYIDDRQLCNTILCLLRTGLPNLEELKIHKCDIKVVFQLEGLTSTVDGQHKLILPKLKILALNFLEELESLCEGPIHILGLQNLTTVNIYACLRLRHIFSITVAQNLLQLKYLNIDCCDELEQILFADDETLLNNNKGEENGNDILFPKLRSLNISHLPNFISLCPKNYKLNWQTLEELVLNDFHNAMGSLIVELEATMKSSCAFENLQLLRLFYIDDRQLCNTILGLLRTGLPNLEELKIHECDIKVVFQREGLTSTVDGQHKLILPKLKILDLHYLKELESLCEGPIHVLGLQNLTILNIWDCHRLRHIFSITLAQNLLQLKHLNIDNCKELEQILFADDQLEEVFGPIDKTDTSSDKEIMLPQLKKLSLKQLPNLTNFCPVGYHFIFPSLETFVVWECPKITTRFSYAQSNQSVHAKAKASQTGIDDGSAKFPPVQIWRRSEFGHKLPPFIEQ